jgi:hypothetical protein
MKKLFKRIFVSLMRFGSHYKVTIHMTSGKKIKVNCLDVKISTDAGNLVGYSLEGVRDNGSLLFISLEKVEAIQYKECFGWF